MNLMYCNILVAKQESKGTQSFFVLQPDLPEAIIPRGLFINNAKEVTLEQFTDWVSHRIPPKNRVDIKSILKLWGLKKYDTLEIAKKNNATVIGDNLWLQVHPDETYENSTFRGLSGKPALTLDYFKQEHPDQSEEVIKLIERMSK